MVFNPATDVPDLSGRVILVTGGNAGIGGATVQLLAAHNPARIYICARTRSSATSLIDTLSSTHPEVRIDFLPLDLSSLESVKDCAAAFNKANTRLDLLFLNSGVSSIAPGLTKEGYQMQWGVNHVGHALLTQLLLPTMLASRAHPGADIRIMVTSSAAHGMTGTANGLALDDVKAADSMGDAMKRYGHSKLGNLLFARGLAQKYPEIVSTAYHPGVVKTEIWNKDEGNPWIMAFMRPIVSLFGRSVENGAYTGLFLATQKVENGAYYEPIGVPKPGSKFTKDQKQTDELWEWTTRELEMHGAPGWPKM